MPFDINAARQANKSDTEIADYLGSTLGFDVEAARKAGKTDTQIAEYLATNERPSTNVESKPLSPIGYAIETAKNIPSSTADYFGNMIKGIVSLPGMAEKAFAHDPRRAQDVIERWDAYPKEKNAAFDLMKQRYGGVDNLLNTIKTDPVGVLGDISMIYGNVDPSRLATGALKAGAKTVTETLPKWAYKSAVKMGTGKGISIAERNKRALTGLDEMIMPTEGGINRIGEKVSAIENTIQPAIDEAAAAGVTIPRASVSDRIMPVFESAANQVNPNLDMAKVAKVERNFIGSTPSDIPINTAQELKKGTYAANKKAYGTKAGVEVEAEKALARGLKEEVYSALEQSHPELKALGEKEGALLNLKESIDSAVKRIQNTEGMPLRGSIAASAGNAPMTLASLMELPRVKAALAIALFKAGQKSRQYGGTTARLAGKLPPYAYGVGKYMNPEDQNE